MNEDDANYWSWAFSGLCILGLYLCCSCLGGCVTRRVEEKSIAVSAEKSVTKEERANVVDLVADVPGVGVVQVKGVVNETTLSETLTDAEAKVERRLIEENPAVQQGMQMIISAGGKVLTGDWLGAGKDLVYLVLTAFGIGGLGYGAKKGGESREKDRQIEYHKADAEEGWSLATKEKPNGQ